MKYPDAFAEYMRRSNDPLASRLAKLDALADPERNPNEHERETAARMAAELRAPKPYSGPTRRWIIARDMKKCRNQKCDGHKRYKCKVTVDGNEATSCCHDCGDVETFELREFFERRACTQCQWEREVRVYISRIGDEHESWNHECEACVIEAAALKHAKQAKALVDKAKRIRFERMNKRAGAKPYKRDPMKPPTEFKPTVGRWSFK